MLSNMVILAFRFSLLRYYYSVIWYYVKSFLYRSFFTHARTHLYVCVHLQMTDSVSVSAKIQIGILLYILYQNFLYHYVFIRMNASFYVFVY